MIPHFYAAGHSLCQICWNVFTTDGNVRANNAGMRVQTILRENTWSGHHRQCMRKCMEPPLPMVVPCTSSHTVPAIYSQGKRKDFNMVHIKREYDLLDTFTNNGSTHDKVKRAGETFVLKRHGASNFESLDKYSHIAYKMAIGRSSLSSSFQLASLPPTSAAEKQHACHTHIPVQERMGNTLPPTEWEWRSRDGILGPVETDMPVAPDLNAVVKLATPCNNTIPSLLDVDDEDIVLSSVDINVEDFAADDEDEY
ncbi:hypothetical protein GQR58_007717 [Nymphon striatum]|nr:hypothetical protein GQR58_007717 [Nymphon striatum]